MIAVTGATGQLGRLVIQALLARTDASNILALVRSPEKAKHFASLGVSVRQADYNQPETVRSALKGVKKLLLISSSAVGERVSHHQAVIEAAKHADLSLFAYTSILKADTSPMALAQEHSITEQMIKMANLPAVILRNGWYTENYSQAVDLAVHNGFVVGAAGQGRFYTASRADYAEAAAVVLTSTENQVGKVYELAGDTGFTLSEFAQEIAQQSGRAISYNNVTGEEYAALLIKMGLPEGFAGALADSEVHAGKGWLANGDRAMSQLIGRGTTSLKKSIEAALV